MAESQEKSLSKPVVLEHIFIFFFALFTLTLDKIFTKYE